VRCEQVNGGYFSEAVARLAWSRAGDRPLQKLNLRQVNDGNAACNSRTATSVVEREFCSALPHSLDPHSTLDFKQSGR
jgi:hypothetical protein